MYISPLTWVLHIDKDTVIKDLVLIFDSIFQKNWKRPYNSQCSGTKTGIQYCNAGGCYVQTRLLKRLKS